MIAKKLKLLNYKSYKNACIEFDKPIQMIIGEIVGTNKSNGSGKSSIFEAIFYALQGDIGKIKNSGLIHEGEKEMSVSFTFDLKETEYEIIRCTELGKSPKIYITINGGKPTQYQVKSGQEVINNIIGASSDVLLSTMYFKQGQLDTFSKLTPKDSKELVLNILQIDQYDKYEKIAKEKIKDINDQISSLNSKIDLLKNQLSEEQNKKTESRYTQEQLTSLEEALVDIELASDLEMLITRTKEYYAKNPTNKQIELNKQANILNYSVDEKQKRINKLEKLLGDKNKCPTCESDINREDLQAIIVALDKELKEENKKELAIIYDLNVINDELTIINSVDLTVKTKYNKQQISSKITEVKVDLKVQSINNNRVAKLKQDIKINKENLPTLEEQLVEFNKLKIAFGKKGIQAYIVDNAIPEIQATANLILKELDSPIQINIKSQKDLKSGGKSETFDITVFTKLGEREYESCSGGEKTFIDFSLRISLSILLSRRMNFTIQTLMLDEVWGELDSVNKLQASKVIEVISRRFDFKRILMISHQEELKDNFPNLITVRKEDNISTILE